MQKSVRLKSFELFPQNIDSVEVSLLHALSISVGWPHRPEDWEFLRRAGQGVVAVDGIGRVFGSAMWFPHGSDFATIGLVITSPRTQAQGNGRWLMDQVFAQCGGRDLSLNATRAAYGLYHSLSFTKEGLVHMYQGEVSSVPAALPPLDGQLDDLAPGTLEEIAALDTAAFGIDRTRLLGLLAERASIRVLRRGGEVVGYSMCRKFGRGHVIGPLIASSDNDAIHLAAVHIEAFGGRFMRVDTRSEGPFADFLRRSGLSVSETVTTMSKGRRFLNQKPGEPIVFGLAGHALG
jgi:ribosomal protein S18 acetylase RimI-like enzyme